MLRSLKLITLSLAFFMTVSSVPSVPSVQGAEKWQQLFNGKNLDGWTPKFEATSTGKISAIRFE